MAGRWIFEHVYISYKLLVEAGPIRRLANFIQPGSWAIDVGANIGFFTIYFCRQAGIGGGVIAIEPEEENFRALERRIAAERPRSKVILRRAVAAEHAGMLHLAVNELHPGDHQISVSGLPVPAVTLDELHWESGSAPVSLIKIDVQGAELRVLQGATHLLRQHHPMLFVEIDELALRRHGTSAAAVATWLADFGYAPYLLPRLGKPIPLSSEQWLADSGYIDVLFIAGSAR